MTNTSQDTLNRFLFEKESVRGEVVQLQQSYQQILSDHSYPKIIKNILGELLAATTLLTATLKFEGDIAVQIQGDGPVSLAVINSDHLLQVRGLSQFNSEALTEDSNLQALFGKGHMVITITPNKGERYQGIVALDKPTISQCLSNYFAQSEQLPTFIKLFADGDFASGMLLQVLPSNEDDQMNAFEHLSQLTNTISADELASLPAQEILHRLFHEEELMLFDAADVNFKCRCSRKKSADAIRSIDRNEIEQIVNEEGKVGLHCDYCNTTYNFDSIDIAAIYDGQAGTNTAH
ncbi:Hsp33 family molecular chaperone HslO [Paraferrimonas sp. SM1919]|uniref:Hsp33 family molecular chaperone HslO n=1 Tax=Paraferrimonas sp. SM1919 TaxID=2662263 RepID=UPI0013D040D6|nr:Hsp33 family molecular chaperone HslO [Paraferrimonas sp. SM1919]